MSLDRSLVLRSYFHFFITEFRAEELNRKIVFENFKRWMYQFALPCLQGFIRRFGFCKSKGLLRFFFKGLDQSDICSPVGIPFCLDDSHDFGCDLDLISTGKFSKVQQNCSSP